MFRSRDRIEIKSADQLQVMRAAGLVVARTLQRVAEITAPGITTAEMDDCAAQSIRDEGATPSFLGYHGFPAHICVSVNEEVVHGIPGDASWRAMSSPSTAAPSSTAGMAMPRSPSSWAMLPLT